MQCEIYFIAYFLEHITHKNHILNNAYVYLSIKTKFADIIKVVIHLVLINN